MSGARLVWARSDDGNGPYTDVEETADAVMDAIDNAVCNGAGWPRLTPVNGGGPIQVNPAWVECVIPTPSEVPF